MRITLARLADAANVSSEDKLNILGLFNIIRPKAAPGTLGHGTLVLDIQLDPSEVGKKFLMQVLLWGPDGQSSPGPQIEILFPKELYEQLPKGHSINIPIILPVSGAHFQVPGDHAFKILVDGQHFEDVPFKILSPLLQTENDQK